MTFREGLGDAKDRAKEKTRTALRKTSAGITHTVAVGVLASSLAIVASQGQDEGKGSKSPTEIVKKHGESEKKTGPNRAERYSKKEPAPSAPTNNPETKNVKPEAAPVEPSAPKAETPPQVSEPAPKMKAPEAAPTVPTQPQPFDQAPQKPETETPSVSPTQPKAPEATVPPAPVESPPPSAPKAEQQPKREMTPPALSPLEGMKEFETVEEFRKFLARDDVRKMLNNPAADEAQLLKLLYRQPPTWRLRDRALTNTDLGKHYPRMRLTEDPLRPIGNVEGVKGTPLTFVSLRYKTPSGHEVRRGGTRVGANQIMITTSAQADHIGPVDAMGTIPGLVVQTTEFVGPYKDAPIMRSGFKGNSELHLKYGALIGSPYDVNTKKPYLDADAGVIIDLAQAAGLRAILMKKMLPSIGGDSQKIKIVEGVLQKSLFLLSSGGNDDETHVSVERFEGGGDGWQIFAAKTGMANEGDTKFSLAGVLLGTLQGKNALGTGNRGQEIEGYIFAGPDFIATALEKKR
jgi:hypothetical protein